MYGLGRHLRAVSVALSIALLAGSLEAVQAAERVSFPTADGGTIHGDLYGTGVDAVILAHGAVFNKESWAPLAVTLAGRGLLVLAIDFRGYGESTSGTRETALYLDILGGVDFLAERGANRISLVGASLGANAVGQAASQGDRYPLSTVVLLAPARIPDPETMKAEKFVFIVSENEPGIDRMRRLFEYVPEPKQLEVIDSAAHAQHVFKTDQGPRLLEMIISSLAPWPGSTDHC